jgi:uncharacterized iron-regulated membrane protein
MNARRLHALVGLWIVLGLVFFSATGLTWSRWAGERVSQMRTQLGWITPSVSTQLQAGAPAMSMGEHADHMGAHGMQMPMPQASDPARFDMVQQIARAGGIDACEIEIRPPRAAQQAWVVREVDRSWPTQVDTVAIDADRMAITSRADFADFPLIAKLIRWGVDAHMGVLFGVANQILMALFGVALTGLIVLGYVMWWRRRPAAGASLAPVAGGNAPGAPAAPLAVLALLLGWSLPLMGASLLLFLLVDVIRYSRAPRYGLIIKQAIGGLLEPLAAALYEGLRRGQRKLFTRFPAQSMHHDLVRLHLQDVEGIALAASAWRWPCPPAPPAPNSRGCDSARRC